MKAYSFLNTIVLVNGVPITGWADGDDVIKITKRVDTISDKVGAGGDMAIAISADKSGELTFKLLQTSGSNKYLNALHNVEAAGPDTFVPIQVIFKDTYRQDTVGGTEGYIKKVSDVERGMGVGTQEWTIVVKRLDVLLGDPAFVGFATAAAEASVP